SPTLEHPIQKKGNEKGGLSNCAFWIRFGHRGATFRAAPGPSTMRDGPPPVQAGTPPCGKPSNQGSLSKRLISWKTGSFGVAGGLGFEPRLTESESPYPL